MAEMVPNIHPLIVHFPIALSGVAFGFLLAARLGKPSRRVTSCAAVGHWALWLSAVFAAPATFSGWLAFNTVNHSVAGHLAMELHRAWALPSAAGLVLLAAWDAWRNRADEVPSWLTALIAAVLFGAIGVTAWLGGELVFRHGIGVLAVPNATADRHDYGATAHDHYPVQPDNLEASKVAPIEATPAQHHHNGTQPHKH